MNKRNKNKMKILARHKMKVKIRLLKMMTNKKVEDSRGFSFLLKTFLKGLNLLIVNHINPWKIIYIWFSKK